MGRGRSGNNVFVEGRFARTWGAQATFRDQDKVQQSDKDQVTFGTKTSHTDTWQLQLGVAAYF